MNAHDHRSDAALERLLAEMFERFEPLPAEARALAYDASQMAALDRELAELVYDSRHTADLTLMRGSEGQTRLLSFANDHLTLDVSLLPDGVSLIGEIVPVDTAELELETTNGSRTTVPVDEFGRFRATAGPGPIRMRVVGRLLTPWITR
jgi:hypothetical protein